MDIEQVHSFCLSFPHVTEKSCGHDLVFKIGGKMFASLDWPPPQTIACRYKCTPEKFAELTEEDGIVPAPYVARYHWVALERFNATSEKELRALLRNCYDLVLEIIVQASKSRSWVTWRRDPRSAGNTKRITVCWLSFSQTVSIIRLMVRKPKEKKQRRGRRLSMREFLVTLIRKPANSTILLFA